MKPKVGDKVQFTYPNFAAHFSGEGLPHYASHSGQIVEIIKVIDDAFEDGAGNLCRGYLIMAEDGWQGTVWPGELNHPVLNEARRETK